MSGDVMTIHDLEDGNLITSKLKKDGIDFKDELKKNIENENQSAIAHGDSTPPPKLNLDELSIRSILRDGIPGPETLANYYDGLSRRRIQPMDDDILEEGSTTDEEDLVQDDEAELDLALQGGDTMAVRGRAKSVDGNSGINDDSSITKDSMNEYAHLGLDPLTIKTLGLNNTKDSVSSKKKKKSAQNSPKRKKKRRSVVSICTTSCRYGVIRKTASKFGLREVNDDDMWNLYWTDLSVSVERAKDMKRFQKINHFPGMLEICRKDLLARNLNRMVKVFPNDYKIFPKTWCFPADFGEAVAYSRAHRNRTFILKPDTGSQGKGIYLTRSLKDVKPYDRMICQLYIAKPFLIDGYKFDLRVYTLITSCDPLRIFIYEDGLVRFATSRYKEPAGHNTTNVFMHLTNYAVNKHSRMFVVDNEGGSKRKISTLNRDLLTRGTDLKSLWSSIDDVIVKTMISAWPILKHSYRACFPGHDKVQACFELLGFDILIDSKMKPYVLEVNHSPSFHTDTQIDREIKESLIYDTFNMLNLSNCDKRKVLEEDRKRIRDRLLQGLTKETQHSSVTNNAASNVPSEASIRQEKWEDSHLGGFRRVYPPKHGHDKYRHLFNQTENSIFSMTASSRAREESVKHQREEFELKNKEELSKRIAPKPEKASKDDSKSEPENKNEKSVDKDGNMKIALANVSPFKKKLKKILPLVRLVTVKHWFEPEPIIESEERERISELAQRDFLIRSYGLLQHIYMALQSLGTLRPNDERRYGIMYGRVANGTQSVATINKAQGTANVIYDKQGQPNRKTTKWPLQNQTLPCSCGHGNQNTQLANNDRDTEVKVLSLQFSNVPATCSWPRDVPQCVWNDGEHEAMKSLQKRPPASGMQHAQSNCQGVTKCKHCKQEPKHQLQGQTTVLQEDRWL